MKQKQRPVAYEERSRGFVVMGTVNVKRKRDGKYTTELVEKPVSGFFFSAETAEQFAKLCDQSQKPWVKEARFRKGIYA